MLANLTSICALAVHVARDVDSSLVGMVRFFALDALLRSQNAVEAVGWGRERIWADCLRLSPWLAALFPIDVYLSILDLLRRRGEDETTYQYVRDQPWADLKRGSPCAARRSVAFEVVFDKSLPAGFKKIQGYCKAIASLKDKVLQSPARKAIGFDLKCDWLWIDTACIDKTDSAELSESLNSMFKCYRNATLCYAYLKDVRSTSDYQRAMLDLMRTGWFNRGWTLRELLAPGVVVLS